MLLCVAVLPAVMGHVISTGLELVGTGSSVRLNQRLASAVKTTVEMASAQEHLTPRERLHVRAMEHFSKGYDRGRERGTTSKPHYVTFQDYISKITPV